MHLYLAIDIGASSGRHIAGWTEDGEIMSVEHREYPVCGVQFHPESVMTPDGEHIIRNFLASL